MVKVDINCYNELDEEELEEKINTYPNKFSVFLKPSFYDSHIRIRGRDPIFDKTGNDLVYYFKNIKLEIGNLKQIENLKLLDFLCLNWELSQSYGVEY